MDFIPELIQLYCDKHSEKEPSVLEEIARETHLKVLKPRMLSGHFQGRLLSFISKMIQPERILEIGTYTGYSAICLAEGLRENGVLITIDCNEELENIVQENFKKANLSEKIQFKIGDAGQVIESLDQKFDLIFIDADKINYYRYYGMIFGKLKLGGVILADNVLWSGKVVEEVRAKDAETKAIMAFNDEIAADTRVEKILLPVRDGLFMMRKIKEA